MRGAAIAVVVMCGCGGASRAQPPEEPGRKATPAAKQWKARSACPQRAAPQPDEPVPSVSRPGDHWCPEGTALRSVPDRSCSDGTIVWLTEKVERRCAMRYSCARPDGAKHGPFLVVRPDGRPREIGQYAEGRADGRWLFFAGPIWAFEVAYDAGRCVERIDYELR